MIVVLTDNLLFYFGISGLRKVLERLLVVEADDLGMRNGLTLGVSVKDTDFTCNYEIKGG